MRIGFVALLALALPFSAWSQEAQAPPMDHAHMHHHHPGMKMEPGMDMSGMDMSGMDQRHAPMSHGAGDCGRDEYWDAPSGMCQELPHEGVSRSMGMAHGYVYGVGSSESGPRGRDGIASPNMLMLSQGASFGGNQYFGAELMLTAERWTFPRAGYPLLTQIGEADEHGNPYIDAQHPHSSPVMGLALSDTLRVGEGKDHVKVFFAPRGESTDGPVAFMHRETGAAVNPDAPLGHHIGQDVGHISSTVIGASAQLGIHRLEVSAFNGTEPEPRSVDLPLGTPNSFAIRVIRQEDSSGALMASVAFIRDPEPAGNVPEYVRYSLSGYRNLPIGGGWRFFNTAIYGGIRNYGGASFLNSFAEEFLFHGGAPRIFGRAELLQRTARQLEVGAPDPDRGQWISAITLGYQHRLATFGGLELNAGATGTKTLLPGELIGCYGGNPWTGRLYLQLSGMEMWGS